MPTAEMLAMAEEEDIDLETALEILGDITRVEAKEKQLKERREEPYSFEDPDLPVAVPWNPSQMTGVYEAPPMPPPEMDDDQLIYPTID